MDIITDPAEMQETGLEARRQGHEIALVPTMGFFHQGHLSLMSWARQNAGKVIVSLFVNPAQFGPGEDLDRYPRNLEGDAELAASQGVDYLFVPRAEDLYPRDFDTWITVPGLSSELCGKSRPGHFKGVTTIVGKLFNLTVPDVAVFGEKDRQQLLVIQRMVRDLNMPVRIVGRPTFREPDGLAMSSRNAYLDPDQRKSASHIYKGLEKARQDIRTGLVSGKILEERLRKYYRENIPGCNIEYISIVDPSTLKPSAGAQKGMFLAVALRLGRARLIDNIEL
ncbi:pantoate--beta-alanine ligase [Desulfonatronovibrio hydrogenovorans]|uniref:pantoate--beta-alanine ligase n=1 Tax=Desulfonatronovibrio hydrogenovorans TaxID=53245 RepID=UPI00048DEC61|nr:pantoate--beta-alanine ligase [Desulfonatronovibrio hydrogenovorans]